MATITRYHSANFGTAHAGLSTVGYTLAGGTRVTAGVAESPASSGVYGASITYDDGLSGLLAFDLGTVPNKFSNEDINPTGLAGSSGSNSVLVPGADSLGTVYCTDEDIALRDGFDYPNLCPRSQALASGIDGAFSNGSPWALTSASVNFQTAGVAKYHVVRLTKPAANYPTPGVLLAVDSVSGSTVTLRRLGKPLGQGMPPAPSAGLTGVAFEILSFGPQIDTASYDANRKFGIDASIPGRTAGDLYELRELQTWVVLTVLHRAYVASPKAKDGDMAMKLALTTQELADVDSGLSIKWGKFGNAQPATNKTNMGRVRR